MAKVQRTILICDRCGIEHQTNPVDSLNVRVWNNVNNMNPLEWKDMCSACSAQIGKAFEDWMITHGEA